MSRWTDDMIRSTRPDMMIHHDYPFSADPLIDIYIDRIGSVSIGRSVPKIYLEDIMVGITVSYDKDLANAPYRSIWSRLMVLE